MSEPPSPRARSHHRPCSAPTCSLARLIRHALLLATAITGLGGCQSMSGQEIAWQSLHAVDVAQTLNAASDPCYQEDVWLTRTLIGEQPSDSQVLAWGVGIAVVHGWISHALEQRGAPIWLRKVWELGTLGNTVYTIGRNHAEGVRAFGDNRDVAGCGRT